MVLKIQISRKESLYYYHDFPPLFASKVRKSLTERRRFVVHRDVQAPDGNNELVRNNVTAASCQ